jgi:hypothetical protein
MAFVVLLIVAFIVGTGPEAETSDATIVDFFEDSSNQIKGIVSAMIALVAVCAFVVFATGLRLIMRDSGAPDPFPDLVLTGALLFAALALTGFAIGSAIPATFIFSDTFALDPDTARIVLTIGNIWLLSFAGASASVLVGAVSLASRRTRLLPRWLEWAGLVLSPLMIVTLPIFGLSAIALFAWVAALSGVLLLRARRAPGRSSLAS